MSFFFDSMEIIFLFFISLDTLGFLAEFRKRSHTNLKDYTRICFTWVFFLIFRSLSCAECSGVIGHFYCMLMLLAKLYITLPMLRGTEKLYDMFIENNALPRCMKEIFGNLTAQAEIREEHSKKE